MGRVLARQKPVDQTKTATTPEEAGGLACCYMRDWFRGSDWPRILPGHILYMLGDNEWHQPLWRERIMPPGELFKLNSFEEYITLEFRRGLGFKNWWALHSALETQGRIGDQAIRQLRHEIPGYTAKWREHRRLNTYAKNDRKKQHGGDRRSDQAYNISLKTQYGTSADYLMSVLKRDHEGIANRYAAGEFRSVRAAAIAAGIIQPDSALLVLQRAWKRATEEERKAFLAEIKK